MSKFKDFDASMQRPVERIAFKVRGRDYTAPPELPAIVALLAARYNQEAADQEMNPVQIMTLLEHLLGKESADDLMESGVSFNELGEVLGWLFGIYTAGASEGKAEAPSQQGA